jgi:hypothetical protein
MSPVVSRRTILKKLVLWSSLTVAGSTLQLACARKSEKAMKDETAENIVKVVDKWSRIETGVFLRELSLKGQWVKGHTVDYETVGVNTLIESIKENSFFKTHQRVGELEPSQFTEGGNTKTEGNLYDFFVA